MFAPYAQSLVRLCTYMEGRGEEGFSCKGCFVHQKCRSLNADLVIGQMENTV